MTRRNIRPVLLLAAAAVVMAITAVAQQRDAQIDDALESLRADFRADKVNIVTEAMNLTPPEADRFWPVYREYETEVAKLNDKRIAVVKDYAAKYATMTEPEAKSMAESFFDWETRRTELRKTYFSKFTKATSALTAAKFFQVEHRLDLLIDLALASEIPGLFVKSTAAPK